MLCHSSPGGTPAGCARGRRGRAFCHGIDSSTGRIASRFVSPAGTTTMKEAHTSESASTGSGGSSRVCRQRARACRLSSSHSSEQNRCPPRRRQNFSGAPHCRHAGFSFAAILVLESEQAMAILHRVFQGIPRPCQAVNRTCSESRTQKYYFPKLITLVN